ncbi:proline oxidase, mitochondrial precursor-like protein [Leishmania panamensis]|uniref:Proline dehydrogenase n=3 Tax=Viannia TaxID=37616 RepID=A0A088RT22_LEIPA|nr:proline oxidase, mitochondrial precursor-like protein [Leishmania panamensis]AIN99272.1 proline oxidase, mitochondrial precursor-like protein [Leishmania panamensis]CCM16447.1 Putative proline oxidase, mitochondrial precursor-like protein [Leishmania guyanensis]
MRRFFPLSPAAVTHAGAARHSTAMMQKDKLLKLPNFNDDTTYRQRSTWYLIKALVVLRLCSVNCLATNSVSLMKHVEKILGSKLTYDFLVKKSFYNYFCAGENDQELRDTVHKLSRNNIGAVLDYAAEADTEGFAPEPGVASGPDISMSSIVAKPNVHYPMDEGFFDENMKLYMMSIMHASLYSPRNAAGVTAVKVTGMCDPQLLARVSALLMSVHQSWCKHFTNEELLKLEECRVVMGVNRKHQLFITYDQLRAGFDKYNPANKLSDTQFEEITAALDPRKAGKVNYFEYKEMLTNALIALEPTPVQQALIEGLPQMSAKEKELWKNVNNRLSLIASTAKELNVRMLVDAEQTFYQLAIDAIVATLQKTYNTDLPVVYNTYQCYLTYAEDRIDNDLVRARHMNFQWGGKIVRGAYIVQERATAAQYGYTSPIWSTYEETNKCYNAAAKRIFDTFEAQPTKKHEVFFGTHNKESLEVITASVLKRPGIESRVSFGQLFGMRDNLTVPLARAGFQVYKYVPYGPVKETIHYLGRRAVENASILTTGDNETVMMKKELKRRCGF